MVGKTTHVELLKPSKRQYVYGWYFKSLRKEMIWKTCMKYFRHVTYLRKLTDFLKKITFTTGAKIKGIWFEPKRNFFATFNRDA